MEKEGKKGLVTAGRWTRAENHKFIQALEKYGRDWVKVQKKVKTRSLLQIRSHAQKYFLNMSENDIKAFIGSGDDSFNEHEEKLAQKQISNFKSICLKNGKTTLKKNKNKKQEEFQNSYTNEDEHPKTFNDNSKINETKNSQQTIVIEANQNKSFYHQEAQNYQSMILQMHNQKQEYFRASQILGVVCGEQQFYSSFCFPLYPQYFQF